MSMLLWALFESGPVRRRLLKRARALQKVGQTEKRGALGESGEAAVRACCFSFGMAESVLLPWYLCNPKLWRPCKFWCFILQPGPSHVFISRAHNFITEAMATVAASLPYIEKTTGVNFFPSECRIRLEWITGITMLKKLHAQFPWSVTFL